jgi:hypothetical protein
MKSRGIFPVILCFTGFWSLVMNFTYLVNDYEWKTKYECFFFMVGYDPTNFVQVIFGSLYILRVFLTIQVNNNKTYIRNQSGKQTIFIKFILFLKYLTTDRMVCIIGTILYVLALVFQFILIIIGEWKCYKRPDNYLNILVMASVIVITFLILVVDFLLIVKDLINCRLKKIFILSDPFYMRIQQWVGLFICIVFSMNMLLQVGIYIVAFYFLKESMDYIDLMNIIYYVAIISFSFCFYAFFFYLVGIVILLTLFNKFSAQIQEWKGIKINQDSKKIFIGECLTHPELKEMFKKFIDSEWSSENYLLYYDIKAFEQMTGHEQEQMASRMFNFYLNGENSELEVNLSQTVSSQIRYLIQNQLISSDMFSNVLKGVEENLSDTYSRFIASNEFKNFHEVKSFIQSQVE